MKLREREREDVTVWVRSVNSYINMFEACQFLQPSTFAGFRFGEAMRVMNLEHPTEVCTEKNLMDLSCNMKQRRAPQIRNIKPGIDSECSHSSQEKVVFYSTLHLCSYGWDFYNRFTSPFKLWRIKPCSTEGQENKKSPHGEKKSTIRPILGEKEDKNLCHDCISLLYGSMEPSTCLGFFHHFSHSFV